MNRIVSLILSIFLAYPMVAQDEIVLKGKELFGSMKARHIGPGLTSGRITDLEGHPTNPRIIYAGTAGGGIWKSNDGGATFNAIFDDHIQSIGVVAVDPQKPDQVVWAGTGEVWTRNSTSVGNGIYKSTDGGNNWKKMGLENSERISSIQINPNNSNEIYVGVLGALWGDNEERGVYKTTDGGQTWQQLKAGDHTTGCSDLIMDPNDPNTLYAAFWEFRRTAWSFNSGGLNSALYKSTDGGKSWKKIHNGFPSGQLGRFAIAVAPSNSKIVYAVVESESKKDKGLYRSEDGGNSWKFQNGDFGLTVRPFYFSRIVVDPTNPDLVVKGGLRGSISRDGGKTFKSLGNMHADIHDIWFDIKDTDRFYVGTDGGVYRTWNGGTTMEMVHNIPVAQFYHISIDEEEPYNIYGGLQDNGSWYGPSSSPGGIEARDWTRVGWGDGFRVFKHREKPIIYSEMQGAESIWRYNTEEKRIKDIKPFPQKGDPKLRFNWNAAMAMSPSHANRIYVGSQFLFRSDDSGDNWTKISPDLSTNDPAKQKQEQSGGLSIDNSGAENNTTIFTIAESPLDDQIIWVGTDDGNVQITQDGGNSWTNVIANIPGLPKATWCYHIEASTFSKGRAYAVFDGHTQNDKTPYAYRTDDFGKTWKSIITDNIEGFARSFQEDYEREDLLFLGTELGLYVTIDGGQHWSKFTNNMPAVAIHHMEMHKGTNDLVMGTHGRGVIILDDVSPLRQLTQEVLAKKVHFFDMEPTPMWENSAFGGGSTETEFVGNNPTRAARIIYYLKKRHTFGKMTLEIQDQEGNKVSSIDAKKQKGINIVTWNYRSRPPKVAKGKTFSFEGFQSPRVSAGTYKVVMKKGKDTYTKDLVLVYDPKSSIPLEARKEQEKTTRELFDMSEQLAYMVHELDEMKKYISKCSKEQPKLSKSGKAVTSELNALKKQLVITTGDNYVGQAEPQLREKISDLYGVVAGNIDRPSQSQLKNLDLLKSTLKERTEEFEKIRQGRFAKFQAAASKKEMQAFTVGSFEEFVDK